MDGDVKRWPDGWVRLTLKIPDIKAARLIYLSAVRPTSRGLHTILRWGKFVSHTRYSGFQWKEWHSFNSYCSLWSVVMLRILYVHPICCLPATHSNRPAVQGHPGPVQADVGCAWQLDAALLSRQECICLWGRSCTLQKTVHILTQQDNCNHHLCLGTKGQKQYIKTPMTPHPSIILWSLPFTYVSERFSKC